LPRYEKGIGTVINGLPRLYQDIGNYLWSERVELDKRLDLLIEQNLYCYLSATVKAQPRKQVWKVNTETLMRHAIQDCRWNNQVQTREGSRYTKEQLGLVLGCSADTFRKDHNEKWNFLRDNLTVWMNSAEQPLYDWMRRLKDAA